MLKWLQRWTWTNERFSTIHYTIHYIRYFYWIRFSIGATRFQASLQASRVSAQHTTITTARYFFLSSYMHTSISNVPYVKSRLNRVAATVKLGEYEIIDEQHEQTIRSFYIFLFLVRKVLNAEEMRIKCVTRLA